MHAALLTYDMLASAWSYNRNHRFLGTKSYVNGRGMHKAGLLLFLYFACQSGRKAGASPAPTAAYGDMIV
ncbi:hypothetical protein KDAU_54830 [Dictyobacter aurantiacus]|uniref:Uncharacterized protein n=1 Tax=Dictyobacter aurantiacus TaxID=1936993 RepID=A0A401ZMV4_9CHLR|nr:hypothetical protein KDAU_54830 [Dictyobacter aurantiacus]